ncbi:MAG: TusE/DsrC/DsvC family sulfur relay protein [Acidimicrobiales bacterium]
MPTTTLAGVAVDTNEEGFFTDPTQWTEAMATELAAEADIPASPTATGRS